MSGKEISERQDAWERKKEAFFDSFWKGVSSFIPKPVPSSPHRDEKTFKVSQVTATKGFIEVSAIRVERER